MRPFSTKEYESALEQKGFVLDRNTKHSIYYLWVEGEKTHIHTMVSHGSSEDIREGLASKIKRQLLLNSSEELVKFVDCPLTYKGYLDILRRKDEL